MLQMSRKCVPYTPVTAPLKELTVALVSSTGIYVEGQEPFGDDTDISYRIIPPETALGELRVKHGHYPEETARQDPNAVFPLGLMQDLAREGFIRRVANKNIGFRGFSNNLKAMYEEISPKIAEEIERSQAEAVLLTAG